MSVRKGLYIAECLCMGKKDPIGIDAVPVLSWKCRSGQNGDGQRAWRVRIWRLLPGGGREEVWDTGTVEGGENLFREERLPLRPRSGYVWTVSVLSESGQTLTGGEQYFETGKREEPWKGKWICTALYRKAADAKGACWYRTGVTPRAEVERARLYVCGVGLYEAYIEGEKVSAGRLTPAYTKYDSRLYYDVLDVTAQAKRGRFGLGVLVGNGRYNYIEKDEWGLDIAPWRDVPRLIAELVLTYADGSEEVIATDKSWRSVASPIVYECLRTGEHYEERLERPDFSAWEEAGEGWTGVRAVRGPGGALQASPIGPVIEAKEWEPAALYRTPAGDWIADFGQNFAGVMRLRFWAKAGDRIRFHYGEALKEDGNAVDTSYIANFVKTGEFQTDYYTACSDGEKCWEPRFVYHGFRYVQISGLSRAPEPDGVRGVELHSEFAQTGVFHTSDPALDQIWRMCCYSTVSNFLGVPSDCPHREKNPWTGDAAVMAEQFLFTYGAADCLEKWLEDIRDNQRPDGSISCIVPTAGWGFDWGNGPDWSKAMPQVLWMLYLHTGRKDLLARHYPVLKKLVGWMEQMAFDQMPEYGIGDWCAPFQGAALARNMRNNRLPLAFTDTACYFYAARILEKTEALLGYPKEEGRTAAIAAAFRKAFLHRAERTVTGDCQSAYAMALYYQLCEPEDEGWLLEKLEEKLKETAYHPDFGLLGAECVYRSLGDRNRADLIYRLAACEGYPGYRYWIGLGFTTLGECWNGTGSRNHYMFADIAAAFYRYLAGICPLEEGPGYRRFLLTPGGMPHIAQMECRVETVRGEAASCWKREGNEICWKVRIPFGCSAAVRLPSGVSGAPDTLGSGDWELHLRIGEETAAG